MARYLDPFKRLALLSVSMTTFETNAATEKNSEISSSIYSIGWICYSDGHRSCFPLSNFRITHAKARSKICYSRLILLHAFHILSSTSDVAWYRYVDGSCYDSGYQTYDFLLLYLEYALAKRWQEDHVGVGSSRNSFQKNVLFIMEVVDSTFCKDEDRHPRSGNAICL
jgi:hypothetical protein